MAPHKKEGWPWKVVEVMYRVLPVPWGEEIEIFRCEVVASSTDMEKAIRRYRDTIGGLKQPDIQISGDLITEVMVCQDQIAGL